MSYGLHVNQPIHFTDQYTHTPTPPHGGCHRAVRVLFQNRIVDATSYRTITTNNGEKCLGKLSAY